MKNLSKLLVIVLMMCYVTISAQMEFSLLSPDKKIEVKVSVGEKIEFAVLKKGKQLITPSSIAMNVNENVMLGVNAKVKNTKTNSVNQILQREVRQKSKEVRENYNELTINFKENFALTFRAFNEGVAYRFETSLDGDMKVNSETYSVNFAGDYLCYFPEEQSFMSHNERVFNPIMLKDIKEKQFASTPTIIDTKEGTLIGITESDLEDYPGLWLRGTAQNSLAGIFPAYVLEAQLKRDRDLMPTKRAEYLALTKGTRTFPWRIFAITNNDGDLITNEMVYLLSKPNQLNDISWIKPGKVAWDWWNFNNIYNVDFRAGVNTETYKYFIDFASKYGIEYIILDEGWYKLGDLLSVEPEMNVQEIIVQTIDTIRYAELLSTFI